MTLAQTQRDLQDYLLGPADARCAILPRLGDGPGIDAAQRLSIYHNAYRARLHEALATVHERTAAYLGDEVFSGLCLRYIERHPSVWRNLRDYGADFGATIRAARPADPEAAELSALEWSLHLAFDAPDAQALDHSALTALDEDDWVGARLVFHPSVSMTVFEWNAVELWHAVGVGDTTVAARRLAQPTGHVFWRSQLSSRFRSLDDAEHSALRDLLGGAAVATVCEWVAPETVAGWLGTWINDGLLTGISSPGNMGERDRKECPAPADPPAACESPRADGDPPA